MSLNAGVSGDQESHHQDDQIGLDLVFRRPTLGGNVDVGVNDDDGTMMSSTMGHSRWRFHESDGGPTPISRKDRSRRGQLASLCRNVHGTRRRVRNLSNVVMDSSSNVGSACPGFYATKIEVSEVCAHGDDFCVLARRKQYHIFGTVLSRECLRSNRQDISDFYRTLRRHQWFPTERPSLMWKKTV